MPEEVNIWNKFLAESSSTLRQEAAQKGDL
jgi:hypothetical protein